MGDSASDLTKIQCECGVRLKVPKSAVGKKAKCPKCSKVFVIEILPPQEESTYTLSAESDTSSFLDDLANLERSGTKIEESPNVGRKVRCAKCGTDMPEDAILCTQCGYNKESGRTISTAKAAEHSSPGLVRRISGAMGGLMKGTMLSGVGAVIGAVVWAVIAIISGYEIGWIAIGVGALAGYGMLLGYPGQNARAGIIAACMALFGIFLGKLFIFVFFVHALITGDTSNIDIQRAIIAGSLTEERLDEREIWGEAERDAQWEPVYDDAAEVVEGWSDEQVRTRFAELKAELERRNAVLEEGGPTIIRVAHHRAARRGDKLGLALDHADREKFYSEEFDTCENLSEAEIADEVKAIDQWQEVGRWADVTYVYNHLIEQNTNKDIEDRRTEKEAESPEDYWEPNERENKRFHEAAKAVVDGLSPDARVTLSQSIETEQEHEYNIARLANHSATRRGNAQGLSYSDRKRGEILEEEMRRYQALDVEAVNKAIVSLDEWEAKGKWADDDYVRDHLIYTFVHNSFTKERNEEHADDEYGMPNPEEWTEIYNAATAKVNAIPANERVQRTHDEEDRQQRKWEEQFAADDREETAELAASSVEWFFSMFEPLDGLFILLAVSSAFRIAQGGSED